jgi:hypothetical protein
VNKYAETTIRLLPSSRSQSCLEDTLIFAVSRKQGRGDTREKRRAEGAFILGSEQIAVNHTIL